MAAMSRRLVVTPVVMPRPPPVLRAGLTTHGPPSWATNPQERPQVVAPAGAVAGHGQALLGEQPVDQRLVARDAQGHGIVQ